MKSFISTLRFLSFTSFVMAALLCTSSWLSAQEIELGAPFADGAVLQRGMKAPVWGWSKPGTKITVEFAGQKKSATTGADGKWMVELDPLKASFEPAEMVIRDNAGHSVAVKDILVGEVWLASGQSNMQWIANKSDVGRVLQSRIKARVEAGEEKSPLIREARITDYFAALHPIERANAEWHSDAGEMSAIAYAFAYELFRELDVPIGILNCSFSQTPIQAWTPRIGFRDATDEYTRAIYQKVLETDPRTPEHQAAWDQYYTEAEEALKAGTEVSTKLPGNMNSNRDATWLFNARLNPMIPYALRGGIWNQGYANAGEGLVYYHNLHSLIRGWRLRWNRPQLPVYFHQFYSPGNTIETTPSIGSTAEMRLGTWLARDIPHSGMASQIDITGAIHYVNKTLAGQRLALHALKNEYDKKVVADGPMFQSYRVEGDKVIIELENVDGGLVAAETGSNAKDGLAIPQIVPEGARAVKLFYLAGEDRVWHPAEVRIDGSRLIVTSPTVKAPRGVTYGMGGVGNHPNIYNQALLPLTPFNCYDHELVAGQTLNSVVQAWPEEKLKIAGEVIDPATVGLLYEWRKMPLLSTAFEDNAVFQAGVPVPIWGSVRHDWGHAAEGQGMVHFSFDGVEKTIPVTPEMMEWRVDLPPMKPSGEPKTLKVSFMIDGELAHERVCTNIVIGDVWYVAAPPTELAMPEVKPSGQIVRMLTRKAKRWTHPSPSRYSVAVSRNPDSRFASQWEAAEGLAAALGHRIAAKSGRPVGIIFMQSGISGGKGQDKIDNNLLKSWIPAEALDRAPSLMKDYRDLAAALLGNKYYEANAGRYLDEWKKYWNDYIPRMIATKAVPDGAAWGHYPTLLSSITSEASETYNVLVHSFTPTALTGVVFLTSPAMVAKDQGALFGEQLTALANSWKERFGGEPDFLYTIPAKTLAPKITEPQGIQGQSTAVNVSSWNEAAEQVLATVGAVRDK